MNREWKPGDVALVRVSSDYQPEVAVSSGTQWFVAGPRLGSQHGWYHDRVEVIRPLVVIDPEDREQVERLAIAYAATVSTRMGDEYLAWENRSDGARLRIVVDLQAALRKYADPKPPKPPKPEEPTGLGAVVEDAEGRKWLRRITSRGRSPWGHYDETERTIRARDWSEIDVVRVLSEGVTE